MPRQCSLRLNFNYPSQKQFATPNLWHYRPCVTGVLNHEFWISVPGPGLTIRRKICIVFPIRTNGAYVIPWERGDQPSSKSKRHELWYMFARVTLFSICGTLWIICLDLQTCFRASKIRIYMRQEVWKSRSYIRTFQFLFETRLFCFIKLTGIYLFRFLAIFIVTCDRCSFDRRCYIFHCSSNINKPSKILWSATIYNSYREFINNFKSQIIVNGVNWLVVLDTSTSVAQSTRLRCTFVTHCLFNRFKLQHVSQAKLVSLKACLIDWTIIGN